LKSFECHILAKPQPASVASLSASIGAVVFQSGVVFVLAHSGVVGLA